MENRIDSIPASILMAILFFVVSALACAADGPSRPFPQHLSYGSGVLMPNRYPREWMDDDVRDFYDHWKAAYLVQAGEDAAGHLLYRVAMASPGQEESGTTVSEGQGYGMIIVVQMAGYDPDARLIFDGLWRFAQAHPSHIDPSLMAWRVSEDDPHDDDNDSAFDGDADMAYALLMADRQWGSDGEVDYAEDVGYLIDSIYESTIGPHSRLPLLGDWVDYDGDEYNEYTNRTSDFMLANFQAFYRFTGEWKWRSVANRSRNTAIRIQRNYSRRSGLLPDFIVPVSSGSHRQKPAPEGFLEEHDGDYYYNACRVPLRIGLDALLNHDRRSRAIVRKLSRWAENRHESPYDLRAGYRLNGKPLPGSDYLSTAFVAPLSVAAMLTQGQQQWLNDIYDAVNREHQGYYEDSLTLLSLLVMTGNFWDPAR